MSTEQSYYIVIPGSVRADKTINAEQKFLYGELAAKCNVPGYCWATNATLCQIVDCTERTLQRNLLALQRGNHIRVEVQRGEGGTERRIWLIDSRDVARTTQTAPAVPVKNSPPPRQEDIITPAKNGPHNTLTEYSNDTTLTGDIRASEHDGIVWPWDTETFWEAWVVWRDYKKKQHRFTFKVKQSEQAALNLLNELAGGSEATAHAIMRQSMGNGWKGFVALKPQQHETNFRANTGGSGNGKLGTSEARNRATRDY